MARIGSRDPIVCPSLEWASHLQAPAHAGDDVSAIGDLCQDVWPLRNPHSDPIPEDRRRLRALANGSVRAFGDIGKWNGQVLHHLATSGQLFVVGFALTGDQVSDSPALVEAKLAGSLVVAPWEQVRPLAEAYRVTCRELGGLVPRRGEPIRQWNGPTRA